jgi:hypothetical protein
MRWFVGTNFSCATTGISAAAAIIIAAAAIVTAITITPLLLEATMNRSHSLEY